MKSEDRKNINERNRQWGQEAETIAAEYFIKEGYVVRERNWKMGHLEIDLILEKGRTLVFVEVKARQKESQDPVEAVDKKKRLNVIRAADTYLRQMSLLYEYRFDIVTLTGDSENYVMQHYTDAYLPPVNGGRR